MNRKGSQLGSANRTLRTRYFPAFAAAAVLLSAMDATAAVQSQAASPPQSSTPSVPTAPAPVTTSGVERFVIGDGHIRILPGASKGEVDVIVSAEELRQETMAAAKIDVTDLTKEGTHGTTKVRFETVAEHQAGKSTRRWFVTARVEELPMNSEQVRYALVRLGSLERVVPYVLSNRPRSAPEFTVSLRPLWVLWRGSDDPLSILVATGEQPVSGLRLAQSTLTEKATSVPLNTQALELCDNSTDACKPPTLIPPLSSRTLYLRIREPDRQNGRFSGAVAFSAEARPEPKTVTLEVASSGLCSRVLGTLFIVAGVWLAWLVSVWGRARVARLAALKPAAAARSRLEDLLRRLEAAKAKTGVDLSHLQARISKEAENLTEKALERDSLLPSSMPSFWKASDTPDLKPRLQQLEGLIAGFTVVVRDGVEPLVGKWTAASDEDRPEIEAGMRLLNAPDKALSENDARSLVAAALERTAAGARARGLGQVQVRPTVPEPLSFERITTEIESLSRQAWWVYLALVSIAGIAMLVISNPGFGTPLDYVYCFFWGFGLPIAFDKLQQLTPTGMASSLSMSLPK